MVCDYRTEKQFQEWKRKEIRDANCIMWLVLALMGAFAVLGWSILLYLFILW